MAEERMAVLDALRKGEEAEQDPLRELVRWTVQELTEAEVAAQIGAGRYERSSERTTQRNGYRARAWDTRVGTLELQIPKLRQGSYFPS
jgi:transposase-like protein